MKHSASGQLIVNFLGRKQQIQKGTFSELKKLFFTYIALEGELGFNDAISFVLKKGLKVVYVFNNLEKKSLWKCN